MPYIVGLDLGQTHDYTALAVVALTPGDDTLALPHLQRFPLNMPYPDMIAAVTKLVSAPALSQAPLVVDQTGVGRPVVDLLRQSLPGRIIPVTITSGQTASVQPDGSRHVPKKDLVTCLLSLLEDRRLKVAKGLPEAHTLVGELLNFKVEITPAANETFGAWRHGQHDDLVLAVALACWWAGRNPTAQHCRYPIRHESWSYARELTPCQRDDYLVVRSSRISISTAERSLRAGTVLAVTVTVICLGMVLAGAFPFGAVSDLVTSDPSTFTSRAAI